MMAVVPFIAAALLMQPAVVIDDFENVSAWKAVPSDDVSLVISQGQGVHGKALRIDFDFHGHGGYAVIHRDLNLSLPANYEFSWSIRGPAPVNTLEFKLIDPSGDNVWWSNQPGFVFSADWRTVVRKKRHITFAWGPLGGGEMKTVAGIEIAITAGTGGKGTVYIDDLVMTPLEPGTAYTLTPKMSVGGRPGGRTLDIDFLKRREFGGLVIYWNQRQRPSSYNISTSKDGSTFTRVYRVNESSSPRDYVYLPESDARYLRLSFDRDPQLTSAAPFVQGLKEVAVKPLEWSTSMNAFFTAVAEDAPAGSYPRYFSNRQSYWTVIGVGGDTREGLIDQQGVIESGKGQFSVEPFLYVDGRLITWNDASRSTSLVRNDLPIPRVYWKAAGLELTITSFAAGKPDSSVLYARYRVRNATASAKRTTLYLAIRPFQVNPPWQFLNTQGGFASIDSISFDGQRVKVNADQKVLPLTRPTGFGAIAFDQGGIVEMLRTGRLPSSMSARDTLGRVTGVLAWTLDLAAGGDSTVDVAIPLHAAGPECLRGASLDACRSTWTENQLAATQSEWERHLDRVRINLPSTASRYPETVRANLAWILINRDGPAIQPGSRSYERSWIRDGALTSAALLRLGQYKEVREFIEWYSRFQFENGKIPCCVDSRGADPVPENDSHGEFIYLIAEYYRHTGDRTVLERTWPNVSRAVAFMDSLRHSRMTEEYRTPDKRVFFGLMPQSISHEGYSAKPMHSYWDDFFALRGFKDAAEIASVLGKPEAKRYGEMRDEFRKDFYASISLSMKQHNIDYIPGAAELGDFDATSTTIAVNPGDEGPRLPGTSLARTFDKYLTNFRNRRDSANWDGYTPYEWRTVGTFVRLGEKAKAHEIADFFFEHQRPKEWRHWAEVVYRDSLKPAFIGDMPHTWVGSDFIRSTLDMFSFEREADSTLVIGAGIPERWVREENGVAVSGLSTHYGPLSYTMRTVGSSIEARIEAGVRIPRGGLVVRSPVDRAVREAHVNGASVTAGLNEVVLKSLPATVVFRY